MSIWFAANKVLKLKLICFKKVLLESTHLSTETADNPLKTQETHIKMYALGRGKAGGMTEFSTIVL